MTSCADVIDFFTITFWSIDLVIEYSKCALKKTTESRLFYRDTVRDLILS